MTLKSTLRDLDMCTKTNNKVYAEPHWEPEKQKHHWVPSSPPSSQESAWMISQHSGAHRDLCGLLHPHREEVVLEKYGEAGGDHCVQAGTPGTPVRKGRSDLWTAAADPYSRERNIVE